MRLLALLINFVNSLHFTESQVSSPSQKQPTTGAKWVLPYGQYGTETERTF